MSVLLISELRRALQNQRADVEIMRCIARMRSPNVSNLAETLGMDRRSVRYHLYKLKGEGCVRDCWVHSTANFGSPILCHEWPLTEKGERLLRRRTDLGSLLTQHVIVSAEFRATSPLDFSSLHHGL